MKKHAVLAALSLFAVAASACSGNAASPPGPTPAPTPSPAPTPAPTATPSPAATQPLVDAVNASPVRDIHVLIGDRRGVVFQYRKGALGGGDVLPIASATKMLAGITILRLVEAGKLRLDDHPQRYLPFWTSDTADARSRVTLAQLLSFTSGFNVPETDDRCITDGAATMQACAKEFFERGLDTEPGAAFAYGPAHLQIAGAMAEAATGKRFQDLFSLEVAAPAGMSNNTELRFPGPENPRLSGGGFATPDDYGRFLSALLDGRLLRDIATYTADRTNGLPMINSPMGSTSSWHYALASWRECDGPVYSGGCAAESVVSSPGAFGWTPWIDFGRGYWGLVAMRDAPGSRNGVALEQELQPLVERLLAGP